MEALIRRANENDREKLAGFLQKGGLSTDGTSEHIERFLLMEAGDGEIHGSLGIEPIGSAGLLRSFLITNHLKEYDVLRMFEQILLLATDQSLETVYLATNKQGISSFFQMIGFTEAELSEMEEVLAGSTHARHLLSVDKPLFMKLNLKKH